MWERPSSPEFVLDDSGRIGAADRNVKAWNKHFSYEALPTAPTDVVAQDFSDIPNHFDTLMYQTVFNVLEGFKGGNSVDICPVCEVVVPQYTSKELMRGVCCEVCKMWYHRKCAGLVGPPRYGSWGCPGCLACLP